MLQVGITGGVGTGKSLITKVFALYDIPVFDADSTAKTIMNSDPEVRDFLISTFGSSVFQDGVLNRSLISAQIFGDDALREKINAIVHPKVQQAYLSWVEEAELEGVPYILKEAAIMIESGSYKSLDRIIGVFTDREMRIERLAQYRGYSRQKSESIMDAQLSDEELQKYVDYKIFNNENQSIILQVENIHQNLISVNNGTT